MFWLEKIKVLVRLKVEIESKCVSFLFLHLQIMRCAGAIRMPLKCRSLAINGITGDIHVIREENIEAAAKSTHTAQLHFINFL